MTEGKNSLVVPPWAADLYKASRSVSNRCLNHPLAYTSGQALKEIRAEQFPPYELHSPQYPSGLSPTETPLPLWYFILKISFFNNSVRKMRINSGFRHTLRRISTTLTRNTTIVEMHPHKKNCTSRIDDQHSHFPLRVNRSVPQQWCLVGCFQLEIAASTLLFCASETFRRCSPLIFGQ